MSRTVRFPVHLLIALLVSSGLIIPASGTFSVQADAQVRVFDDTTAPAELQTERRSVTPATTAQTAPSQPGDSGVAEAEETPEQKAAKEVQRLITRYEHVRECDLALQRKPYQPESHAGKALLVLDTIEYNITPGGPSNGNRFLIAQLHVVNQTEKPVTMTRDSVRLKLIDEPLRKQSEIDEKIQNYSFEIGGNQSRSFNDVKRPEKKTIPPGGTDWMWIYFSDLELGANLPDADIQVELDGQPRSLNLKSQVRGQLYATRQDIGPAQSLALIEVGGRINMAALTLLAELFDELLDQKVVRVVFVWKPGAPQIDSNVTHYLYQYAVNTGRINRNRNSDARFPILNEGMQEVHFARLPGSNYSSSNEPRVMHDEPVAAVSAALWSALSVLPKNQLLKQIREGHEWVRPAALSAGAAQLSAEDLPLVLEYSRNEEDPMLQLAAVFALRQFGDEAAVQRLIELAAANHEKLTPQAIAGLSQSRFQSGRAALRKLLETSEPEKRQQLMRVIAEHPAPAFTDLYYLNVTDPKSPLRVESLQALNAVGHEELIALLKTCLDDPAESVRNAAFEIILARQEPELEPLLETRVLTRLEKGELTPNIQNYLRYTKHPAAIPILIERLKEKRKDQNERQQLISLLSQIGDQRIGPLLVELYPDLQDYEKRNVLETLGQIQSPEFLKFAKEGIVGNDASLVYTSIDALSKYDSLEAENILVEAFDQLKNESYYGHLANTLSQIGSSEAEEKLRAGRKSQNSQKRLASINGLRYLQQRKPGYQYIYQALYQMSTKKLKEALDYINTSIAIDDSLAEAHAVKGTILLSMKKADEAERAYARALELDEETGEAVVGRLRIKARQGKLIEAIADFRKIQDDFVRDNVFEFHAGLLFADAVTLTTQQKKPQETQPDEGADPKTELPEGQVELWKTECLGWCSDAIRHGYNNPNLIRNAPELKQFEKHPDFEKAMKGQLPERELPAPKEKPKAETPPSDTAAEGKQAADAQAGDQVIIQAKATEQQAIIQPLVIDLPPAPIRRR